MKLASKDQMFKTMRSAVLVTKADGTTLAVASNASLDRDGEIILPSAFAKRLDYYRSNPVILAAHTHRSWDGSPTIIGASEKINLADDQLSFVPKWATETRNGKEWGYLYDNGFAKAFSVGFIPYEGEWKRAPKADGEERSIYVHTEIELIEISAVPVGSNRDALSLGIDPDGKELKRLIDARVQKALQEMYTKRLLSLFE